ncbi:MAG: LON peptidase substrate-binding domain-containing protein [Myxococcota bacterium]|nr:LON peptidase substrate-binding domain-containing protein [Myxococcota bacterium]
MNNAMDQLGQHCWKQLQAYTDRVAIFPLPGATLLPRASLPLHIFEPRYRAMVEYALSHGRFIGMIQPVPDKKQADGRSVLYDVGCIGRLTSFRELPDGRFLIVLDGLCRFRPVRELGVDSLGFRSVEINLDGFAKDIQPSICEEIKREELFDLLTDYANQRELSVHWDELKGTTDEELVNNLAMNMPLDAHDKQTLVEAGTLKERLSVLYTVLKFENNSHGESEWVQ